MRHKHSVSNKVQKFRKDFIDFPLSFKHFVSNVGEAHYLICEFLLRVDECGISVYYLAVLYFDSTYFDYLTLFLI